MILLMSFNHFEIKEKLKKLKELDKKLTVFGASSHLYNLKEPLEPDMVLQFEEENSITLPQDYKEFLTYLGDGGAGRGYCMMSLNDTILSKRDLMTPFKGVDNLLMTYAEIQWNEDRENLISLYGNELKTILGDNFESLSTVQLFNVAIEAELDFTDQYFNFAEPNVCEITDPVENRHSVYMEINRNKEFIGYLSLFAEGCGHEWGLIVNGEDYGKMVFFGNDGQISATNQSFIEFYDAWLNLCLAQFE